jgi:hypothetical protein
MRWDLSLPGSDSYAYARSNSVAVPDVPSRYTVHFVVVLQGAKMGSDAPLRLSVRGML